MSSSEQLFSLVVPVLNEEEVIQDSYATLTAVLGRLGMPYEVIVVDNGSTDRTPALGAELCARDPRWKYIRLSRNFGYQNSITAGMLAAHGDAIMVIDADLQDPPELIPEFVARWREGYEVVYGVRGQRTGESKLRVTTTMMAMRFISWMSDEVKMPLHSGDFRLISRRVRDAFAQLPEANRYVRGMIHWLGYKQLGIPYVRRGRIAGQTKVNPFFLMAFTFNAVCSCSIKPLRFCSLLGFGTLALCALLGLYALVPGAPGRPSISTLLALLTLAFQGVSTGVLGEYIARIDRQSKQRPLWLVDYTLNMEPLRAAGTFPSIAPSAERQDLREAA